MDDATRQKDAERESQARILAEKVLFTKIEEESSKPMMRVVACDDNKHQSKAEKARLEALKKRAGI